MKNMRQQKRNIWNCWKYGIVNSKKNNLVERGLIKIKAKLKMSGGFRNLNFAKYYCSAISIIDTCKKQNKNIYETIMGKKKIVAF